MSPSILVKSGPPPARRTARRAAPRLGVLVAWLALLSLIPFLINAARSTDVDATPTLTSTGIVAVAGDDVRADGDGQFLTDEASAYLGAGAGAHPNVAGFRFTGLAIPSGTTIVAVEFSLVKVSSDWTPLRLDLAFEASADAPPFAPEAPPTDRPTTTTVVVSDERMFRDGDRYTIGDPTRLAASLQEVVARADWHEGNAVVLIAYGPLDPTLAPLAFATADAGPEFAPQIKVTYRVAR